MKSFRDAFTKKKRASSVSETKTPVKFSRSVIPVCDSEKDLEKDWVPRAKTFLAAETRFRAFSIERRRHTRARDSWRVSVEFERAESYTHARHVHHARAPVRLLGRPLPTARASRRFGVRRSAFVPRRRVSNRSRGADRRLVVPPSSDAASRHPRFASRARALTPFPPLPTPRATAGRSPRTPPSALCPTSAACPLTPSMTARRMR